MQRRPAGSYSIQIPVISAIAILLSGVVFGQQTAQHKQVLQLLDRHAEHFSATSRTIWEYAELGY